MIMSAIIAENLKKFYDKRVRSQHLMEYPLRQKEAQLLLF